MTSNRLNIGFIVVCQSLQALAYGGIALFLPLIRQDLNLSFSQAGSLAAAASGIYALMQIPSGYLADRFTPKRLFLIGLLGTNILTLLFATLRSYQQLVVNQALSGFFRALVFAPGLLLISSYFPSNRRATAMGIYVAGGFSSSIVLSAFGPFLVGPLGWRWLFVIFAVIGLVVLAAYWWLGNEAASAPSAAVPLRELVHLLRRPVLWITGLIQFVRLAVVQSLAYWLPSYVIADKGFSLATAGLVVLVGAAVTAPANFLGGYLSDRFNRPLLVIGLSLGVLATTLSALTVVQSLGAVLCVIAINSIFVQVYFGPLFSVAIQRLGDTTAGVVSGFGNFCANIGGFTLVYLLGATKDATGEFQAGLLTLALLCVVGLAATVGLGLDSRRRGQSSHDRC